MNKIGAILELFVPLANLLVLDDLATRQCFLLHCSIISLDAVFTRL